MSTTIAEDAEQMTDRAKRLTAFAAEYPNAYWRKISGESLLCDDSIEPTDIRVVDLGDGKATLVGFAVVHGFAVYKLTTVGTDARYALDRLKKTSPSAYRKLLNVVMEPS